MAHKQHCPPMVIVDGDLFNPSSLLLRFPSKVINQTNLSIFNKVLSTAKEKVEQVYIENIIQLQC